MTRVMVFFGGMVLLMLPACWIGKDKEAASLGLSLKQDSLYKIVPAQNYDASNQDDCVKLMPLDFESGFIHLSFGKQVENILKKFFKNSTDIILLELDAQVLQSRGLEIRKEQNKPGGDFFPHIYGVQKFPASAVISVITVYEAPDGGWTIRD